MSVKNYNKLDISKNLSEKKGFSLLFSKKIVDELIDIIKESLIDKNINLKNLGNFKLIQKKERIGRNPKTMEKFKILPTYTLEKKSGPHHKPIFKIIVKIPNSKKMIASGSSKKNAQQNAAKKLLDELKI